LRRFPVFESSLLEEFARNNILGLAEYDQYPAASPEDLIEVENEIDKDNEGVEDVKDDESREDMFDSAEAIRTGSSLLPEADAPVDDIRCFNPGVCEAFMSRLNPANNSTTIEKLLVRTEVSSLRNSLNKT
jgi:hypothetical protein